MLQRRMLLAAVVVLASVSVAQAQVTLGWKLKEGDQFSVESTTTQKLNLTGLSLEMKDEATMVTQITVKKVANEGFVLEEKVQSVKTDGMGQTAILLGKIFKELEGKSVTITFDPVLRFQKMDGQDEIVKAAGEKVGLPPQALPIARVLVMGQLMKPIEGLFAHRLPERAVTKGEKWTQRLTVPLQPLGNATSVNTYTYDGTVDGKEKITIQADISIAAADKADGAGGLAVKKAELKPEHARGSILFDAAAGRVVAHEFDMKMKGPVTLTGSDTPIDLEMQVVSKSKLLEKAP